MITGASNGIGKEAARALAKFGTELVLVCRDRKRAEATVAQIAAETPEAKLSYQLADLSSQASIRILAKEFLARQRPLHILLNNAGAMYAKRLESIDGIEMTFALNHLGYFLLTNLLLDRIQQSAPARIVNVSSRAHLHARGGIHFDDIEGKSSFNPMHIYGQSKLANILFTRELARRLQGTKVTVNCLHPGFVATGFGLNNEGIAKTIMRLIRPFARDVNKGAQTSIYLCSSPEVENISGEYFADCRRVEPGRSALDDEAAARLWKLSAEMTGLKA